MSVAHNISSNLQPQQYVSLFGPGGRSGAGNIIDKILQGDGTKPYGDENLASQLPSATYKDHSGRCFLGGSDRSAKNDFEEGMVYAS